MELKTVEFDSEEILNDLHGASESELDQLTFGVIGFDSECVVQRYNALESRLAGLSRSRVVGHPLFTVVAPCMNNYLVAQRFEDAMALSLPMDQTLPYVLTLRMRPIKVQLRLVSHPAVPMRYLLVHRPA